MSELNLDTTQDVLYIHSAIYCVTLLGMRLVVAQQGAETMWRSVETMNVV